MAGSRALRLGGVGERVVRHPNTLWTFAVTLTSTVCPVETMLGMTFLVMRSEMELRDDSSNDSVWIDAEGFGPCLHPGEEVYEPLTDNVIADYEEEKGEASNGTGEDVIHVRVSR